MSVLQIKRQRCGKVFFVSQKAEERRVLWKLRRVLVLDSEDGF